MLVGILPAAAVTDGPWIIERELPAGRRGRYYQGGGHERAGSRVQSSSWWTEDPRAAKQFRTRELAERRLARLVENRELAPGQAWDRGAARRLERQEAF